jgi:putative DNA primase/helicase
MIRPNFGSLLEADTPIEKALGTCETEGPTADTTNRLNHAAAGTPRNALRMITSENATGGTKGRKPNHCSATIAFKNDLLNVMRSPDESFDVEVDALVDSLVLTTETAAKELMQEHCQQDPLDLEEAPVEPLTRYQLLTGDDLCKLPAMPWNIKNVLPSRGIAVMFGPSGSGKSFLVLDMLQSLGLGSNWFGHKVKQCSVTYIALEGEAGVAGRIKAYSSRHESTSVNIRYVAQPFKLLEADDLNDLAQAIRAAGTADVVVLDTLSRATPGSDENDSKAMGLIISSAKILQEMLGGLLLLVHHTGKDASKGMRGHSSLHAAVDCAIEVKRNGDHREWLVAKSKDGEDGVSHSFALDVVPLGHDSDGDEITSCVVVSNQSAQAVAKKTPRLGRNQGIVINALKELLRESVDIDKDGAPQGRPCVDVERALAAVVPLMPAGDKHKKERADAALAGLVAKNVLGMKGGWLWVN